MNAAGRRRILDQRTGLHRLHLAHLVQRHGAVLGLEIEHLPAGHAVDAGGTRQRRHQGCTNIAVGMRPAIRQKLERHGLKRIAGEDRRRLVKGDMAGRLAPPRLGIIHGRKIVMDKGIGMQALDRCRHGHRTFRGGSTRGKTRRGKDKACPQPLAAIHRGILHGPGKPPRRTVHAVEKSAEICLDGCCVVAHGMRKRHALLVGAEGGG